MSIWDKAPAPLGLCPHPEKRKFPDRPTALKKLSRVDQGILRFGTYECVCGWWHLYTRNKFLLRRRNMEG